VGGDGDGDVLNFPSPQGGKSNSIQVMWRPIHPTATSQPVPPPKTKSQGGATVGDDDWLTDADVVVGVMFSHKMAAYIKGTLV